MACKLGWQRGVVVLAMIWVFGSTMGCQYNDLMQERDELWTQNLELQERLDRCRAAQGAAQRQNQELAAQVNQLQAAPPAAPPATPPAAANTGAQAFQDIEGIQAIQGAGQITIQLPGDILFAPGKVGLKKDAKQTLSQITKIIQDEYPNSPLRVIGHTDNDPIKKSKWADNLELSLQRAAAVHRYLQEQGIDPQRMEAVGAGAWHPQASKAASRRVEIIIIQP